MALLSLSCIAQNNSEEALIAFLGDDLYNEVLSNSPEKLEFYKFRNEKGYYLTENPGKASFDNLEDALEVEPRNSSFPALTEELLEAGIDFLAYRFQIPKEGYKYYRIGQSDRILVVHSDAKLRLLKKRTEG